ncbi:peptidoglycan editing factor PgeF [Pacificimonas sp. WHA3]|uniref:Purine nucleoside phosphorylase n=1 Tax=Pacificimonas pallii TaxID=2827236 RepID=A0ABS6SGG3_9SPHN|nr:peptidoglycan editing factor PgeF [Pacificimonas pallii]MBV7257518.1 peptidoglycan editing factor PgeF [Pacificimonas pallii]
MTPPFITASALGVPHGFFGRQGGVSTGPMASLQCGFGADDDIEAIRQNRARAAAAILPGAPLSSVRQVHGTRVITVTDSIAEDARPEADALVTDRPGRILGILTADCAPLLFADAKAGVVGAAHAGWKGAFADIAGATVAAMCALGATRAGIVAAIGPCIARGSYEVDAGFYQRFCASDPENDRFFANGTRAGHHQFDLEAFNAARLAAAGISNVICLGRDTYAEAEHYYSYRRATHRGEPDYGRQISLIARPDDPASPGTI